MKNLIIKTVTIFIISLLNLAFGYCQTVTCPTSTNLGTYDCNTIDDVPPKVYTTADAIAVYGIAITGALPNTFVTTIDSDLVFYCVENAREVTREIIVYNDLDFNFEYTPGEEVATCEFTISTVPDTTPPSFVAPQDANTTYTIGIDPSVTGTAIVSGDQCQNFIGDSVNFSDAPPTDGSCAGEIIFVRLWSFTDACGNTNDPQTQVITVLDNTGPTFTVPADITLPCGSDPNDESLTGTVTGAIDEYDPSSINVNGSIIGDLTQENTPCPGSTTYIKRWGAVDDCGNATTMDQIIVVECPPDFHCENLTACYSFDENFVDLSGNENDGTSILPSSTPNYTTDRNGVDNKALEFTEFPQLIELPENILNCVYCTQSFWMKTTAENGTIISAKNENFKNLYKIRLEDGKLGINLNSSSDAENFLYADRLVNDGEWHHIVIVLDKLDNTGNPFPEGLKEIKIYVDEASQSILPESTVDAGIDQFIIPENTIYLGIAHGFTDSYLLPTTQFVGSIDDLQFYDKALTFSEIQNIEDCNTIGPLEADCNGDCAGNAASGTSCDDGDPNTIDDVYDDDCNCVGIYSTCGDSEACNYNGNTTSPSPGNLGCDYLDCKGECGGEATFGRECKDGDNNNGVYDEDCNCIIPTCEDVEELTICADKIEVIGSIPNGLPDIPTPLQEDFITIQKLSGNIVIFKDDPNAKNMLSIESNDLFIAEISDENEILYILLTAGDLKAINIDNKTYNLIAGPAAYSVSTGSNELMPYSLQYYVTEGLFELAGFEIDFTNIAVEADRVEYGGSLTWPKYFTKKDKCSEPDMDKQIKTALTLKYIYDDGLQAAGQIAIPGCYDINIFNQFQIKDLDVSFDTEEKLIAANMAFIFPRPNIELGFCFILENECLDKVGGSIEAGFGSGVKIGTTGMELYKGNLEIKNICSRNENEDYPLTVSGDIGIRPFVPPPIGDTYAYELTGKFIYVHGDKTKSLEVSSKSVELLSEKMGEGSIKYDHNTEEGGKFSFGAEINFFDIIDGNLNVSIIDYNFNGNFDATLSVPDVEVGIGDFNVSFDPSELLCSGGAMGSANLKFATQFSNDDRYAFLSGCINTKCNIFGIWEKSKKICVLLTWDNGDFTFKTGSNEFVVPYTETAGRYIANQTFDPKSISERIVANATFNADNVQPYIFVKMTDPTQLPVFNLTLPNGDILTPENYSNYPSIFYGEIEEENNTAFYFIDNPIAGTYQVNIVKGTLDSLKIIGTNTAPSIEILEVIDNNDGTITIEWFDSDPDNNAQIEFRLDVNKTNSDGIVLISDVDEDDELNQITIPVDQYPTGSYYLVADIIDSTFQWTSDYYPTPINIVNSQAPNAPSNLMYELTDTSILLNWEKNNTSDDIYYYAYYANEPGTINYNSNSVSFNEKNQLEIVGLEPGHYFEFMVTAYDSLFRESTPSNIVSFNFVSTQLNNTPLIVEQAFPPIISVGQTYTHQVLVEELDGENLTYSLTDGPDGMMLDSNGLIEWTPTADDEPFNNYWLKVTDKQGASDSIYIKTQLLFENDFEAVADFSKSIYFPSDDMGRIIISDLNFVGAISEIDEINIALYTSSNPERISITASELEPNSRVFAACFGINSMIYDFPNIQLNQEDTLWVAYQDLNPETLVTQFAHYREPLPDCDGAIDECGVCNGTGAATWYEDADGDGLGNPSISIESCVQPESYVANADDTNDEPPCEAPPQPGSFECEE